MVILSERGRSQPVEHSEQGDWSGGGVITTTFHGLKPRREPASWSGRLTFGRAGCVQPNSEARCTSRSRSVTSTNSTCRLPSGYVVLGGPPLTSSCSGFELRCGLSSGENVLWLRRRAIETQTGSLNAFIPARRIAARWKTTALACPWVAVSPCVRCAAGMHVQGGCWRVVHPSS